MEIRNRLIPACYPRHECEMTSVSFVSHRFLGNVIEEVVPAHLVKIQ